jgi:hypothetical protein
LSGLGLPLQQESRAEGGCRGPVACRGAGRGLCRAVALAAWDSGQRAGAAAPAPYRRAVGSWAGGRGPRTVLTWCNKGVLGRRSAGGCVCGARRRRRRAGGGWMLARAAQRGPPQRGSTVGKGTPCAREQLGRRGESLGEKEGLGQGGPWPNATREMQASVGAGSGRCRVRAWAPALQKCTSRVQQSRWRQAVRTDRAAWHARRAEDNGGTAAARTRGVGGGRRVSQLFGWQKWCVARGAWREAGSSWVCISIVQAVGSVSRDGRRTLARAARAAGASQGRVKV